MAYTPNRLNSIYAGQLSAPKLPEELDFGHILDTFSRNADQYDYNNEIKNLRERNGLNRITGQMIGGGDSQFTGMPHSNTRTKMMSPVVQDTQVSPEARMTRAIPQQQEVRPQQKPMNVVINDMSPYERATIDFKHRELGSKERMASQKLGVTDENTDARIAIAAKRADIYDFKAKNPGMKFMISKGGNIVAMDPITGQPHDTGVSSGTLSERERMSIQNTGDLAEIEARGNIQKDIQGTKGTQNLAQIAARVAGQKDVQNLRGDQTMEQIIKRGEIGSEQLGTRGEQLLAQIAAREAERRATKQVPAAKPIDTTKQPAKPATAPAAKPTTTPVKADPNKPPPAPAGWKYVKKPGGGWTAVEDK